jgi:hypothetical protein
MLYIPSCFQEPPLKNFLYLQYAFNLFSHNAPVLPNGYNEEEMKLVKETRKIWVSIETISLTLFLIFYMLSPDLFKFPLVDGSTSLFGLIQNESSTFFFFFFF